LTVTASGGADAPPPRTAGIVTARISAAALCAAVRAIAQGLAVFSPGLSAVAVKDHDGPGVAGPGQEPAHVELTPRELEVLRLLAEGASNKAIARRLGITPHTAKFHVASIIGKLGASGRTDAVAKALRQGLLMI
jgi:DNA-binding NarL/FixJ family response regulator